MGGTEDLRCMDEYLEDEVELPGFRFHPTDEELVSFYLRRKLDNKPIRIELIKQIDIYKYDPWDLPKASSTGGEKEWYFYCKRGRKYRNSIRPNRVTGSGFWKATGIDKPVYSHGGEGNDCIGLKKTLVYYRGSAGKGTKTDWMMHEFRLPPTNTATTKKVNHTTLNIAQEAEIWTLCRIFKRNASQRKCTPDWRHLSAKRHSTEKGSRSMSSSTVTVESRNSASVTDKREAYINFGGSFQEEKPLIHNNYASHYYINDHQRNYNNQACVTQLSPPVAHQPHQFTAPSSSSALSFWINQASNDLLAFEDPWDIDELGSVVQFAL